MLPLSVTQPRLALCSALFSSLSCFHLVCCAGLIPGGRSDDPPCLVRGVRGSRGGTQAVHMGLLTTAHCQLSPQLGHQETQLETQPSSLPSWIYPWAEAGAGQEGVGWTHPGCAHCPSPAVGARGITSLAQAPGEAPGAAGCSAAHPQPCSSALGSCVTSRADLGHRVRDWSSAQHRQLWTEDISDSRSSPEHSQAQHGLLPKCSLPVWEQQQSWERSARGRGAVLSWLCPHSITFRNQT